MKNKHAKRLTGSPMPVDVLVGQRIKIARLLANLSQTDLAAACGVTFQQVQKYESGFNRVSASRLHQIATVTERPISFFFEGADPSNPPENDPLSSTEAAELVRRFFRLSPEMRVHILALIPECQRPSRADSK